MLDDSLESQNLIYEFNWSIPEDIFNLCSTEGSLTKDFTIDQMTFSFTISCNENEQMSIEVSCNKGNYVIDNCFITSKFIGLNPQNNISARCCISSERPSNKLDFINLKGEISSNPALIHDGSFLINFSIELKIQNNELMKQELNTKDHEKVNNITDDQINIPYIGLQNQGATCYMNSFLQSLYNIPFFRKLVYHMDSKSDKPDSQNIVLNLQRLFGQLQLSKNPVSTIDLTRSFGWTSTETFQQNDVEEFLHVFLDNLNDKMKGTSDDGLIVSLFSGKTCSYIKIKDLLGFDSYRLEDFWVISLKVKDCDSLNQSFQNFLEVEQLTGSNKYDTGEYGKHDAQIGTQIVELPPILYLQLKRFDYNPQIQALEKINSSLSFDIHIDLKDCIVSQEEMEQILKAQKKENDSNQTEEKDNQNNEELSPNTNKSLKDSFQNKTLCTQFELFGVLVHCGNAAYGHYMAYLRPTMDNEWYKFNDSVVSKVSENNAIENNFGNGESSFNAYMLIYIRTDCIHTLFEPVSNDEIPNHVLEYITNYQKQIEMEIIRKRELENTLTIFYFLDDDLSYIASKGSFAFESLDKNSICINKYSNSNELYNMISNKIKRNDIYIYLLKKDRNSFQYIQKDQDSLEEFFYQKSIIYVKTGSVDYDINDQFSQNSSDCEKENNCLVLNSTNLQENLYNKRNEILDPADYILAMIWFYHPDMIKPLIFKRSIFIEYGSSVQKIAKKIFDYYDMSYDNDLFDILKYYIRRDSETVSELAKDIECYYDEDIICLVINLPHKYPIKNLDIGYNEEPKDNDEATSDDLNEDEDDFEFPSKSKFNQYHDNECILNFDDFLKNEAKQVIVTITYSSKIKKIRFPQYLQIQKFILFICQTFSIQNFSINIDFLVFFTEDLIKPKILQNPFDWDDFLSLNDYELSVFRSTSANFLNHLGRFTLLHTVLTKDVKKDKYREELYSYNEFFSLNQTIQDVLKFMAPLMNSDYNELRAIQLKNVKRDSSLFVIISPFTVLKNLSYPFILIQHIPKEQMQNNFRLKHKANPSLPPILYPLLEVNIVKNPDIQSVNLIRMPFFVLVNEGIEMSKITSKIQEQEKINLEKKIAIIFNRNNQYSHVLNPNDVFFCQNFSEFILKFFPKNTPIRTSSGMKISN